MTDKVKLAFEIAIKAHYGQYDKAGVEYINHPVTVSGKVDTENEKIVALLHDVVEDTTVTLDDLRLHFDEEIVHAIDLLTHKDEDDYMTYLSRIKENPLARAVKLADLEHNMDMSRFKKPTKADFDRLENKYKKAYAYLNE